MRTIGPGRLQEKRLKRLLGPGHGDPLLQYVLGRLEGVQRLEDVDGGRSVEWLTLASERERKIAMTFFWRGVDLADELRRRGVAP